MVTLSAPLNGEHYDATSFNISGGYLYYITNGFKIVNGKETDVILSTLQRRSVSATGLGAQESVYTSSENAPILNAAIAVLSNIVECTTDLHTLRIDLKTHNVVFNSRTDKAPLDIKVPGCKIVVPEQLNLKQSLS